MQTDDLTAVLKSILYLVHHSLVASFVVYVIKTSVGAILICYLLVLYEVSTIFFSMRNMMKDIGLKQHPLANICELLFAFLFTVSRVGWGSFVIGFILFEETHKCPLPLKILLALFQLLNYYWFFCLVKIALFKIKKS
eukprot:UN10213